MRKVIPIMLLGASVCSSISPTLVLAAKNQDNNANSSVWEDPNSKSWGSTPSGVKTALSRVKVLGGSDVNVFNVQWLKEMSRSPSMYHLSDTDVKWANQVIKDADSKNRNVWSPNSKVVIKDTPAVKPKQEQQVVPKKESVEQKTVKAESKPLPKPIFSADNKSPDLTPVPVKSKVDKIAENKNVPVKRTEKVHREEVKVEKPVVKTIDVSDETIDKVLLAVSQLSNDLLAIQKQKKYEERQEKAFNNIPDVKYVQVRTENLAENALQNTPDKLPVIKEEKPTEKSVVNEIKPTFKKGESLEVSEKLINNEDKSWMSSAFSTLSLISGIMFLGLFGFYKATGTTKRKKYF